jgi:hypothetical protein
MHKVLHTYTCDRCSAGAACDQIPENERIAQPGDPWAQRDHVPPTGWVTVTTVEADRLKRVNEPQVKMLCAKCANEWWNFVHRPGPAA